jgi:hypothetical protein
MATGTVKWFNDAKGFGFINLSRLVQKEARRVCRQLQSNPLAKKKKLQKSSSFLSKKTLLSSGVFFGHFLGGFNDHCCCL